MPDIIRLREVGETISTIVLLKVCLRGQNYFNSGMFDATAV
jgi:hypothetical protein